MIGSLKDLIEISSTTVTTYENGVFSRLQAIFQGYNLRKFSFGYSRFIGGCIVLPR